MVTVERKNGALVINKDGKIIPPIAYMTYITERAKYQEFIKAGYKTFSICVYLGDNPVNELAGNIGAFDDFVWKAFDKFDFSSIDNNMQRLFDGENKDLYVILRVNLNMPNWWRKENLEELTTFENGKTLMQSIFSEKWKKDACYALAQIKNHIDQSWYRESVIGIQVAGMQTEEWLAPCGGDYSKSALKAFKRYCQDKYFSIKNLNRAWSCNYNSFDELTIPTSNEKSEKDCKNPNVGMIAKIEDYHRFFNKGYSDAIRFFCKYVRSIYQKQILVGCFYGYITHLNCNSGHSAFSDLINCDDIDFFASPFCYTGLRPMATDWAFHGAVGVAVSSGKLWFVEADVRTYKTECLYDCVPRIVTERTVKGYYYSDVWKGPSDLENSMNNIIRSFSKIFISRNAFWWFDMWGGWYENDEMMDLMKKMHSLYFSELERDNGEVCEIAVILDQNTSYYLSDNLFNKCVVDQFTELGFLGASYKVITLDKFDESVVAKCKMLLFLAPKTLTDEHKVLIDNALTQGKQVLFTGDKNKEHSNSAEKCFTIEQLKEYAIKANVHLYSYGNVVYANERYLSVTAATDDGVKIKMPFGCKLKSFVDEKVYDVSDGKIEFNVKRNKTFLFEILR